MAKNYGIELLKPKIKTYILEHPRTPIKEIARIFDISATAVSNVMQQIKRNEDGEYTKIVSNAKKLILKGQEKIGQNIDNLNIKNYKDLESLSHILKDMSDISKVAEETTEDNMIIPVNITINYGTEETEANKLDIEENGNIIEIQNIE